MIEVIDDARSALAAPRLAVFMQAPITNSTFTNNFAFAHLNELSEYQHQVLVILFPNSCMRFK